MHALIEQWLKGSKNFIVGRSLYKKFGNNEKLKKLLENGESAVLKSELEKALKLIQEGDAKPAPKRNRQFDTMPQSTDPVLIALESEWKDVYKRMNYKIHQLDSYGTRNDLEARTNCHALAKDILQLEKEVNFLWEKYDHYVLHGRLPDVKNKGFEIPTDPLALARFINSCSKQIRRYRESAKKNPKHAQLLADYTAKLEKATGKKNEQEN